MGHDFASHRRFEIHFELQVSPYISIIVCLSYESYDADDLLTT